jgi:beta-lactamase regulating signal transducer with metallopeptidase domain/DUF4097 and DUF4098 domain-containing protein YvlB
MLTLFFESALRSLILASIVWAGLRLFRVHNVVAQRSAWTAVLVCSLLMPFALPFTAHWRPLSFATIPAPAPLHRLQSAFASAQPASPAISAPSVDPAPLSHYRLITPQVAIAETSPSSIRPDPGSIDRAQALHLARAQSIAAPAQIPLARWALLAYLLIAAALLVRLLYGLFTALRLWYSSTPVTPEGAAQIGAGLNLRANQKIATPVTIGSGIVLPANYTSWTDEKLRIVLAHELAHVSQHDFHLQILASFYAAVAWFSPLGWWLKRKLSDLGEAISDRSGLSVASDRSAYAQVLLEFAAAPRPTLIGVPMARPSSISRRIERMLNDNYARLAFSGGAGARVAVLVVPVVLFAGAALVRVQAATQPAQAPSAPGIAAPILPAPPATPELTAPPASPVATAPTLPPASPASADLILSAPSGNLALATPTAPPAPPAASRPAASGSDNAKWEGSFDRTLSINGKLELSVSTGSGSIKLTRGSSSQVQVHGVVRAYENGDTAQAQGLVSNPPIEQDGNTVRIGLRHENLHNISIDYVIEAPADAALNATTGSGDITDTGVGQDAKLTTGSGNITASGLENGFNILTGSGDIAIDGTGQGDEKVQTGSGDIDVKGVHGALRAQTGSGGIKASGTPSAAWKLETGSGDIELITGNAPMSLDASTGSGRVSADLKMTGEVSSDEEHHHLRMQLNGGGPEVVAQTGSGDIRVR